MIQDLVFELHKSLVASQMAPNSLLALVKSSALVSTPYTVCTLVHLPPTLSVLEFDRLIGMTDLIRADFKFS